MEMSEKKKTPLSDLMDASLAKIREMVDSNTVVGQPITTPDGVTLIPVSRLSFGFGAGGSDYGKQPTPNFGGGAGAGVKVDPVLHKEVLTRYDKLHLSPYKGFINPVYHAERDAQGNITNVTLDYTEPYDQQMLRYSRDYATLPLVNE